MRIASDMRTQALNAYRTAENTGVHAKPLAMPEKPVQEKLSVPHGAEPGKGTVIDARC